MGILTSGSGTKVAWIGTIYHILINVFSTALLSASNYCMQVVTGPTRDQADAAHVGGGFVDIGVLSLHNLQDVGVLRQTLFGTLAISSPPLHLFYNSAVSEVLGGRAFTVTTLAYSGLDTFHANHDNSTYRILSNEQWAAAYSTNRVTRWGNLYLFVDAYSFGVYYSLETGTMLLEQVFNMPDSGFGQSNQLIMLLTNDTHNVLLFPDVSLPKPFAPDHQDVPGFSQSATYTIADAGWLYYDAVAGHVQTARAEYVSDSSKVEISLSLWGLWCFATPLRLALWACF
ncbi:uncharacterized protein Z519_07503 [Cladophialophora bantiana CBS 173.52]|uniref:DUF6536 domain-containing protein n=1 Tax=Cladophialophora bantiana (strain ATCC 10958 / CBS 173.52 / CDC B-1940 / NIH 8579) TaxID=1442370 RepID=A0A0D2FYM6_CLAB1|nr:uncharacterized protein Z519_07503 [Cladophialophora bantiana CBS 173.52]KIW91537.1 hypothetical protein Z519_07503 [Cladophialophora bantiana CBS 173.52]